MPEVAKGKIWAAESRNNLAGLEEFTRRTCPNYLDHPNDPEALRAFNDAKARILDQSPVIEKQGRELIAFLDGEYERLWATFQGVGLDFGQFS